MKTLGTAETLRFSELGMHALAQDPPAARIHKVSDATVLPSQSRWAPRAQLPEDKRTKTERRLGMGRILQLRHCGLQVELDHEAARRREAAKLALKEMVLEQRVLLLRYASRSVPLFNALVAGDWETATKLVQSQPVTPELTATRRKLHVWLTLQTSNALEAAPEDATPVAV